MSPVLSAEMWGIMLAGGLTAALTAAIRWFWRRGKGLGDL
jgi:hypothetical protein